MKSYRAIFIWIGIFAVIGIVLLMVACETGVLTGQNGREQIEEEQQDVQDGDVSEDIDESREKQQTGTDRQPATSDEPERLTVGKSYSEKLVEDGARNILFIGQQAQGARIPEDKQYTSCRRRYKLQRQV